MHDTPELRTRLRRNTLFAELADSELDVLIPLMQEKRIAEEEFLIHEGDVAEELYIIMSGNLEVLKRKPESQTWHRVLVLSDGQFVGEMALFNQGSRSASVRAISDCVLVRLRFEDLALPPEIEGSGVVSLRLHFAEYISRRLSNVTEQTVAALEAQLAESKARVALGILLCTLLVLNSGYVLTLQLIMEVSRQAADTIVTGLPIIAFFSVGMLIAIKQSGYPLSMYGFTTRNWRRSVIEAVVLTLPLLLLNVLLKWLLIHYHPAMRQDYLFDLARSSRLTPVQLWLAIGAYAIFSIIQEMIARGAIQSSFQAFLEIKHKTFMAILMANLIYSMSHLHLSAFVALLVFLPGLFWGWLYSRQKTIIGVSVSHILVGVFFFYVVGVAGLLD